MSAYKPGRPNKYNPSTGEGQKPPAKPGEYRIRNSAGEIVIRIGTHKLNDARLDSNAAATVERSRAGVSFARWPNPITAAVEDT